MKREEENGGGMGRTEVEARRELARRVRAALDEAAVAGWEEAGLAGLCGEGAFETAVGRMRSLELEPLISGGEERPDRAAIIEG